MLEVWTEKYRSKNLNDVIGQENIVKRLKALVNSKNIPNLLFAGAPGTGKTSCALAIAKELFGDDWRNYFLELNASDERGIDVVRVKVKDFARTKSVGEHSFKLILLDEADALTKDAQHALRRTMENYTRTCRFILSVNYSSKIIEPIQSRCAVFKFKPLSENDIKKCLSIIAEVESLSISSSAFNAFNEVSNGDLRRAINILQACAALDSSVNEERVYEVASYAKPKEVLEALDLALKGDFRRSRDLMIDVMLKYGLSGVDAIKQIQKSVWDLRIPDSSKVLLIDRVGEYEFRMVEGSDPFIQIEALLAQFYLMGSSMK